MTGHIVCSLVFHEIIVFCCKKHKWPSIHSNMPEVSLHSTDKDTHHHCCSVVKVAPGWILNFILLPAALSSSDGGGGVEQHRTHKENTRETTLGDQTHRRRVRACRRKVIQLTWVQNTTPFRYLLGSSERNPTQYSQTQPELLQG